MSESQINSQVLMILFSGPYSSSIEASVSVSLLDGRDHKFLDKTICYQILILIRVGFY